MKLLKLLFKLILFIIILVALLLGGIFYAFSDSTDDTPLDLYSTETTVSSEITPLLNNSLTNLGTNYSLDLTLNSDNLNNIIYALIKQSLNENYNPKDGTTDSELYINSDVELPTSIPVVGGKKLIVKHAYATINNDEIEISVTADAFGFLKTRFVIGLKFETTDENYEITLTSLRLGKLDLTSGIGKSVYNMLLSNGVISENSINNTLAEKDLPFTLDLSELKLISTKQDFGAYIKSLINKDQEESETSDVLNDFVDILTDPENNMINLNSTNNTLCLKINLEKLKVDESLTTLNPEIKEEFDTTLFIQNKVQTFAISCITSTDKKLTFSELEFSKLIYNQTNGYADLGGTMTITEGVEMKYSVEGITIDITDTQFNIYFILNINGLLTSAVIIGDIEQISDTEIHVNLSDEITIGDNLTIGSQFLDSVLAETMSSNETMTYDKENRCFIVTSSVFQQFIDSSSTTTALNVSKIRFVADALEIYVTFTDPTINLLLDTVTATIEGILGTEFIDETQFDTTDPAQAEAIENISSTLSSISTIITDPTQELSAEDTTALIEDINNLSPENQQIFMTQLEEQFISSDLTDLYDKLFSSSTGE